MSYDTCLTAQVDTGAAFGPVTVTVEEIGNYTSNVAHLWEKALGCPLEDLNGQTARIVIPQLSAAVSAMESDPERKAETARLGSWGTYEEAIQYLHRLRMGCITHPKATVKVSH